MTENAGIERNVKSGTGKAILIALVVVACIFIGPQLNMLKIEGWIGELISKDVDSDKQQPSQLFQKAQKDVRKNLNKRIEKERALQARKETERQKALSVSEQLPLLMVAVQKNNLYLVKHLIEQGVNPQIQDIDGNEALAYVTNETKPEVVAYLLKQGLDINHRNKFQNTPLMFAIRYENIPTIRFMVEQGADVTATTRSGRTMVSMAKGPKVRAYLQSLDNPVPMQLTRAWWRQADLNEVQRVFEQNPQGFNSRKIFALAAANTSDTRIIQFLIDKGFEVNQVDETGITPIFSAASSNGNPAILRYLVERGADVNRSDEIYGTTPLMAAAYFQGNPEIFETLLALGANPNQQDRSGQTAVDYARRFNSGKIIRLLQQKTFNKYFSEEL